MNLNCELIYNSVSFGDLSLHLTHELYKRGIAPNIFPIANQVDLSSFDRIDDDFKLYLQSCLNKAPKNFKKYNPSFKLWHISGSWTRVSEPSSLLTFFELDSLTDTEINILNSYSKIFVTSQFSKQVFEENGVTVPVIFVPMGVDSLHTRKTNKTYYTDGSITFALIGKFEKRKWTKKVIQTWCKRFGVKPVGEKIKYRLHLHVNNPFYNVDDMNRAFAEVFENKPQPVNVGIYPYVKTLSELNDSLNCANIILDMSGGESLSLGLLRGLSLGKHAVVLNASAIKDYAEKAGAVLVEPSSKEPAYDGKFFFENQPFNQGNIFSWEPDAFVAACEEAIKRVETNPINEKGFILKEEYSFAKGVDIILKNLV